MKTYVDAYKETMEEDITPIIVFIGKNARDYVQDFANELNVKLIPVKNKKAISIFKLQ